ncbi:MAG TPA: nickel ABC transporter, nickel/metallophore periplasmic binding protein [Methanosarcina sp.]|jgi:nickel transport system substrate-binding protein|nr:nickel ABC transporter, nickel/metallophore periplasmic binding protein [Methanosarcina sp.]
MIGKKDINVKKNKRTKIIITGVLTVGLLTVVLIFSGCIQQKEQSEDEHTLIQASSHDIGDINGHLYGGAQMAQGMVYETLVENTFNGPKPRLAESWNISDDGKVYTFYLRKNVKFQDGEPFNAQAVKDNIDAVQRNKERHAWLALSSKIVSCDVVDNYTVNLVLSEAYYPTLNELGYTRPYSMMSPKCFLNGETKNGVSGHIGTGPYKLIDHVEDQYATFEANPNYWGGEPSIKKIIRKVLPTGQTTLLALQKKEVNFLCTESGGNMLDFQAIKDLEKNGDYQITQSDPVSTKILLVNTGNPDSPLADKSVREAVWYAIDRNSMAKLSGGEELPAETLMSKAIPYCNIDLKARSFDPEKARQILDAAGWKLKKGAEYRTRNGETLKFDLCYFSAKPEQKTMSELIQSNLKEIGIQLELIGEENNACYDRRKTGNYDMLFDVTWGVPYEPHCTANILKPGGSYDATTKGLPEAEKLNQEVDDVLASKDEATRKKLYAEIFTTVHEEANIIPLTYGHLTVIYPKNLEDVHFLQNQYEFPFKDLKFK